MALIGNGVRLSASNPMRQLFAPSAGTTNPAEVRRTARRNAWAGAFAPTAAFPNGYRHPDAWLLPPDPGPSAIAADVDGAADLDAAAAGGRNAEAALTGSGTLSSTLQLIVSAVAALTGSGTMSGDLLAVLQATAALAGTGTAAVTATALGRLAAAAAGTGTAAATATALGELEAALTVASAGGELTAQQVADAVWDTATSGHATSGTFGLAVALIHALGRNRIVTDPATGTFTVYADDDTTVLLTGDLWQDAAGTIPYAGAGAERRDRLT